MQTRKLNRKPSEKYLALLKAARELAEAEGEDEMSRACAEAVMAYEEASFIERNKVKPSSGSHVCVKRLQGSRRCNGHSLHDDDEQLPGADHISEWIKDGKTEIIVSQPYGLSWRALKEIVSFCEAKGLEAEIDAGSWWFPGRTLVLEYRKASE